jgi:hypothetical protein
LPASSTTDVSIFNLVTFALVSNWMQIEKTGLCEENIWFPHYLKP